MRLLFVSEATGWCGGANQICLTAARLIRRGHAVTVACPGGGELATRLRAGSVPVVAFVPRQDYDLFGARRLAAIARSLKAQLVHAHHPRAHALVLLSTLFGMTAPIVVTRRVINPIGRNPFSRVKYASARVSRYIAVCEAAADELEAAGVERSRIVVIPSGVDMDRWREARASRPGTEARRPWVISMVGHYSPQKGHDILLEAAALTARRRSDIVFQVAGRDTERLKPAADRLALTGQARLLGERNDVPALLGASHVCVMPSLREGIGTALIEAQAGLVPAVASRVGGLPQVVEHGVTGLLVEPGRPDQLAEAVLRLLDNRDEALRLAQAGYERAVRNFSIDSCVDRLERVYSSLAA